MKPIYLELSYMTGPSETGQSRFWGNPDLPEDIGYPMYEGADGESYPYVFICQIRLEDIAPFDTEDRLPHKGLLSFFAKIDRYLGNFDDEDSISGYISEPEDVRVFYIRDTEKLDEVVLLDMEDEPIAPKEMKIKFSHHIEQYADEHAILAAPTHREWETWDPPFEDWEILLQIDSCEGPDHMLNFMDCGVLDFLIHPEDLRKQDFSQVRAIVLST